MATKLTNEAVLAQWNLEHPDKAPNPDDLKRMRGTMLKRAERARKKVAVDIETTDEKGNPTITIQKPGETSQVIPVKPWDGPALSIRCEASAGKKWPLSVSCDGEDMAVVEARAASRFPEDGPAYLEVAAPGVVDEGEFPAPAYESAPVDKDETIISDVPIKFRYFFIPILEGGQPLEKMRVDAFTQEEAEELAKKALSPAQRDVLEYLDLDKFGPVEAFEKRTVAIIGGGSALAAIGGLGAFRNVPVALTQPAPHNIDLLVDAPVPVNPKPETEEDMATKKKPAKKNGKRIDRAVIVASAAFIALFEKARKKMRDPERKTCKAGHKICAANAHVGDLKRLGRYNCNPCNDDAQARYNGK